MKLAGWELYFYRLPYAREVTWAYATENSGVYALLKLLSDDGIAGIAEGSVRQTRSGVSPRSLAAALEDVVLPQLKGIDLASESKVSEALGNVPENRLAKAMVDTACWTLRAARAGTPLWRLWGGDPGIELSWMVTRQEPAAMAADAAGACARHGFRAVKVKGGQGLETDLRALSEIRAAVGPGIELFLDANGAYSCEEALTYVRAIAASGVTMVEDPCPLAPDAGFEALQLACGIPLLVDFSCASSADAQLYMGRGARALSAKPARVGLSESRAIERIAAAGGARVAAGISYESALGTWLSLQHAAVLPRSHGYPAEHSFFLALAAQVAARAPEIRNGRVELPAEADLSRLVDWDAVRRYAL